jgi:hypothetical protein
MQKNVLEYVHLGAMEKKEMEWHTHLCFSVVITIKRREICMFSFKSRYSIQLNSSFRNISLVKI